MNVQLMHAGEETFFILIPLAIIYALIEFARRRKKKREAGGPTKDRGGKV